jgi:L-seryl-tRNA(Ser) seleniumtransferase
MLYDDPQRLPEQLPTIRLLTRSLHEITALATGLSDAVQNALGSTVRVDVVPCDSQIGSGALPVEILPSAGLRLTPIAPRGGAVDELAQAFRQLAVPVIGRIREGALWLDMRCLEEEHVFEFTAQLANLRLSKGSP